MHSYKKGDVVLVSFPTLIDGSMHNRRRPGVIVSNDYNNARLDDVLLIPLTSKPSRDTDDFCVTIAMNSEEGKAAGLRLDSFVDCTVIATIPKTLLVTKIGAFPEKTLELIDDCIKRNIGADDGDGHAGAPVPC
ncbi:MAG: type II toxin-antitoxin system PemK/MazF family toxin [Cyanobacteria bacterium SZAS-4]|nr:type II toxin-antitoxin system PemK/MazF family toxin [Cyanobacteria bacterium SZAS-4]